MVSARQDRSMSRALTGGLAAIVGALLVALAAAPLRAGEPAPKPHRVVSINLCVDELLLRLADRRNIASITWLSRNPAVLMRTKRAFCCSSAMVPQLQ